MQKIIINILSAAFLFTATVNAQTKTSGQTVKNARFTYPLIERWVAEYTKENPELQASKELQALTGKESPLSIITSQPSDSDLTISQQITYVGRYALVPVTNRKNPLLEKTPKNGLSKKQLKKIFFEESEELAEDYNEAKSKFTATVYSRGNNTPSSIALAKYFGAKPEELKGKKVLGDDIYLLSAIRKDTTGITFNSLSYVFDTQSRKLSNGIVLVPLNVKTQQREVLSSPDLDNTISLLENSSVENIPVEKIGFILSQEQRENKTITAFIKWILTKGQAFNHAAGFLQLDEATLAFQKEHIDEKLLSTIQ